MDSFSDRYYRAGKRTQRTMIAEIVQLAVDVSSLNEHDRPEGAEEIKHDWSFLPAEVAAIVRDECRKQGVEF